MLPSLTRSLLWAPVAFLLVLAGCSSSESTTSSAMEDDGTSAATTATSRAAQTAELGTALDYVNAFASELNTYEKRRATVEASLEAATDNVTSKLGDSPSPATVQEVTNTWRSDLNRLADEVDAMDAAYTRVEVAAKRYFNQLNRQSALITRESLRAEERARNNDLETAWNSATDQATADMNTLRDLLVVGEDYYVTLLNASVRAQSEENLGVVRGMSEEGASTLSSLADLTEAARQLVGSRTTGGSSSSTDSMQSSEDGS